MIDIPHKELKLPFKPESHLETFISYIYFTKDYVYKLYKPIKLDFVDLTTKEKRFKVIKNDFRINKLFSPKVYLSMIAIKDSKGTIADYAIKMMRFPPKSCLSDILKARKLTPQIAKKLADKIAAAHGRFRPRKQDEKYGTVATYQRNIKVIVDLMKKDSVGKFLSKKEFDQIKKQFHSEITRLKLLFKERIKEGKIQRLHGDLHAENVFVKNSEPYLTDVIIPVADWEHGDVVKDVGALAMDFDAYGYPKLSRLIVEEYVKKRRDQELREILPLYKLYWATVRFWVYCSAYKQGDKKALEKINRYKRLIVKYLSSR